MSSEEGRSVYATGKLSEQDAEAIQEIAGNELKRVMDVVTDAVIYYITHYDEISKSEFSTFWSVVYKSNGRRLQMSQLKALAYSYQESNDHVDLETLEKACEIMGVEVESILDSMVSMEGADMSGVVIRNPKGLTAAKVWVAELMSDKLRLPVSTVKALAEARGFNWNTVGRAKGTIKNIVSVRGPENWFWEWHSTTEELLEDVDVDQEPEYKFDLGEKDDEAE